MQVELHWSWLAAPYFLCTLALLALLIAVALMRGDRVLRIGLMSAVTSTLPWAICQGFVCCTDDAELATHLMRAGQPTVALVGPNLLFVLLGASGQLERQRWIARLAGVTGVLFVMVGWATPWVVPGMRRLDSGVFYVTPGPLTAASVGLLALWLGLGLFLVGRSTPRGAARRDATRLMLGVVACVVIGGLDMLLLYGVWNLYPVAWIPATIAALIALYVVLRTDMLRPQGFDRSAAFELIAFTVAIAIAAVLASTSIAESPVSLVLAATLVWAAAMGVAWTIGRGRPVGVVGERALEAFVAGVAALDDAVAISAQLAELWQRAIGLHVRATWWRAGDVFARVDAPAETWRLPPELVAWLVRHGEPIAVSDLATMRLGPLRAPLEGLGQAHGASLFVPLVDRDELVALVETDLDRALRDRERGLVEVSARASARALTFVELARAAARERETEREVEIAEALRQRAAASRHAELGHWIVDGEYRGAPRTTGAGWSAAELADGRLALLVTEAQAHGVAAALATAALTGAFAAATTSSVQLDELADAMRAAAERVTRGGEPVATFLAVLDARARALEWACAGHPGGVVVATSGTTVAAGSRGKAELTDDALLVIGSTALRADDERFRDSLRDALVAPRLATELVDSVLAAGAPREDLLAVVVRSVMPERP